MENKLVHLRKDIDAADAALLAILAKRAIISGKIGALKRASGRSVFDKARQMSMIKSRISMGRKKRLSPLFVRKLFKLIHDESVRIQEKVI